MKKFFVFALTVYFAVFTLSCSKDEIVPEEIISGDSVNTSGVINLKAALGTGAFNVWTTCSAMPYVVGNGYCVPVGTCSTDINAAQQKSGQTANGMQFYGCFKGGSAAYSSASEESVFVCDNVSQWNGNEMGFVKTLNDNVLKAYLQGGGAYIYTTVLTGSSSNAYHTFKCQARSNNSHMVDFYIDGAYKCTLTNNSGNYYNRYYYFVGTNHWYGGGAHAGYQIEMYSMQVW